jgi:hypothetical protein
LYNASAPLHALGKWQFPGAEGSTKKIVKTYQDGILFGSKIFYFFMFEQIYKKGRRTSNISSCGVQRRGVEVVG